MLLQSYTFLPTALLPLRRSFIYILTLLLCFIVSNNGVSQTIINPSNTPGYDSIKAQSIYTGSAGVSFVTDSFDYQPGSTVHFTGGGFFANEFLQIKVTLKGNPSGTGAAYFPFDIQCDVAGGFDAYWYVDSQNLGRSLEATVLGLTSGYTSMAAFTDGTPATSCYFAPDATYTDFPANDDGSVAPKLMFPLLFI